MKPLESQLVRYAVYARSQRQLVRLCRSYPELIRQIEAEITEMRKDAITLGTDMRKFDGDLGMGASRVTYRELLGLTNESSRHYSLCRTTRACRLHPSHPSHPAISTDALDALHRAQDACHALNRHLERVWTRVVQSAGFFADAYSGTNECTYMANAPDSSMSLQ